MQSPLTPQRGRIESNPREYTHMGPRLCGELETMLADRRPPSLSDRPKILARPSLAYLSSLIRL